MVFFIENKKRKSCTRSGNTDRPGQGWGPTLSSRYGHQGIQLYTWLWLLQNWECTTSKALFIPSLTLRENAWNSSDFLLCAGAAQRNHQLPLARPPCPLRQDRPSPPAPSNQGIHLQVVASSLVVNSKLRDSNGTHLCSTERFYKLMNDHIKGPDSSMPVQVNFCVWGRIKS